MHVFHLDDEFIRSFTSFLGEPFGIELVVSLGSFVPYDNSSDLILSLLQIFNCFILKKSNLDLVSVFIQKEMTNNKCINTLFRENSFSSSLITTIFKQVGHSYLRRCIAKNIKKICNVKESLEIDPNRAKPGSDINQSICTLKIYTNNILTSIYKSLDYCPVIIRNICWILQSKISKHYLNENSFPIVTGFIFLRFFCPAIFDPTYWGIVKIIPTKSGRRSLVLISKIIQVLANGALFGDTHDNHMVKMNSFLEEHRTSLHSFINQLPLKPNFVNENEFEISFTNKHPLSTLVLYFQKHFISLEDKFTSLDTSMEVSNNFEKFRLLLSQVEIFDENEFLDISPSKPKPSKHMKLKRVLSGTFLDHFGSYEEFKEKDDIKDIKTHIKHKRSGSIHSDSITASSEILSISLDSGKPKKEGKRFKRKRIKGKGKHDKHDKHDKYDDETVELLKKKIESLKLQVQMLGERNADLRLENHNLKKRNFSLEKQEIVIDAKVTRQASSPNSLSLS